jgi:hypothetical protein
MHHRAAPPQRGHASALKHTSKTSAADVSTRRRRHAPTTNRAGGDDRRARQRPITAGDNEGWLIAEKRPNHRRNARRHAPRHWHVKSGSARRAETTSQSAPFSRARRSQRRSPRRGAPTLRHHTSPPSRGIRQRAAQRAATPPASAFDVSQSAPTAPPQPATSPASAFDVPQSAPSGRARRSQRRRLRRRASTLRRHTPPPSRGIRQRVRPPRRLNPARRPRSLLTRRSPFPPAAPAVHSEGDFAAARSSFVATHPR